MLFYKSKDFQTGLKVEVLGNPYVIIKNEFISPGKGQAFNKLKLKNILNNHILTKTIKIGSKLKKADLYHSDARYIYNDNSFYYFLDICSFEYYEVASDLVLDLKIWLKTEMVCSLTVWNSKIIHVKIPKFVNLKVLSVDLKSASLSKKYKESILETGFSFKVPLFVKENDVIRIDTEKKEYISRITR